MSEISIMLDEWGSGWLATALDEDGDTLAEANGSDRVKVAAAIAEEVRSYLAGEDGWDE